LKLVHEPNYPPIGYLSNVTAQDGTRMQTRAEHFRAKSLECLHAAQRATDQTARASFLELAERWRELAEQVEGVDRQQ
jgi:hypothetical protein